MRLLSLLSLLMTVAACGGGAGIGGKCNRTSDCGSGLNCTAGKCAGSVAGGGAGCGNGVVDADETCDDGNTVASDGCSALCLTESAAQLCGNARLDNAEDCDDGGAAAGDGCSSTCTVEEGHVCNDAEPSVCSALCGNATLDVGEGCDDGNATSSDGCSSSCFIEAGFSCAETPSVCLAIPARPAVVHEFATCDSARGACAFRWSSSGAVSFSVTGPAGTQSFTAGEGLVDQPIFPSPTMTVIVRACNAQDACSDPEEVTVPVTRFLQRNPKDGRTF